MSYPPAPPPSGGVNPYDGELFGDATPPVVPGPPAGQDLGQPWQQPRAQTTSPWQQQVERPPWEQQAQRPPWEQPPQGAPWEQGPASPYLQGPDQHGPYQHGPYQHGPYQHTPWASSYLTSTQDNRYGVWSLVVSVLGFFVCFVPLAGIGLGVTAVVLGSKGRRAADAGRATNRGSATAGLVIGVVLCVLGGLVVLGYLSNLASA